MSMEWHRVDSGLNTHPKRTRVQKLAGCSKLEALAHINLLFMFTATHAEDGGIEKFMVEEIEEACEWTGEAGKLYKAFLGAGFIEEAPGGKIVHEWYERNFEHVEKDRRRKKISYKKEKEGKESPGSLRGESSESPGYRQTDTPTDQPIPIRERIDQVLAMFLEARAARDDYKGVSYDPGDKGHGAAVNLICGPKPPNDQEIKDALGNFFASTGKFTYNHSASSFFGRFYDHLAGPVDDGGKKLRRGDGQGGKKPGGDWSHLGDPLAKKGSRVEIQKVS